jgi:hypothetical protein
MLFTLRTVSPTDFTAFAQSALAEAKSGSGDHYTYDASIIGAEPVSGSSNTTSQSDEPGSAP